MKNFPCLHRHPVQDLMNMPRNMSHSTYQMTSTHVHACHVWLLTFPISSRARAFVNLAVVGLPCLIRFAKLKAYSWIRWSMNLEARMTQFLEKQPVIISRKSLSWCCPEFGCFLESLISKKYFMTSYITFCITARREYVYWSLPCFVPILRHL